MRERDSETWWRRTITPFLGVLFGTYRRGRRDVLIGVVDTYHWDVLVRTTETSLGVDLFETSWKRTDGTSLLRPFETSLRRSNKTSWRRTTETSWRRSIETSLGVSFGTYLRRHWDVQRDVVTRSPRRVNAEWDASIPNSTSTYMLIMRRKCPKLYY